MADKQRLERTIVSVKDEPRIWAEAEGGPAYFVGVTFEGDEDGEVRGIEKSWAKHRDRLRAIIGKPGSFELIAAKEYAGRAQWKIADYPGKPEPSRQGSPGGATRVIVGPDRSHEDPEQRASIEAQVAAKVAGRLLGTMLDEIADVLGDEVSSTQGVADAVRTMTVAVAEGIADAKAKLLERVVEPAPALAAAIAAADAVLDENGNPVDMGHGPAPAPAANGHTPISDADLLTLRDIASEMYGSAMKAKNAHNKAHKANKKFDELTGEELDRLIASHEAKA